MRSFTWHLDAPNNIGVRKLGRVNIEQAPRSLCHTEEGESFERSPSGMGDVDVTFKWVEINMK